MEFDNRKLAFSFQIISLKNFLEWESLSSCPGFESGNRIVTHQPSKVHKRQQVRWPKNLESQPQEEETSSHATTYEYGAAQTKLSTRSKIPPCSGIKSPKSFRPASRFNMEAVKSPIKPNNPSKVPCKAPVHTK